MSLSTATITPGNLELSPVRVKFNGVDLGATLGNATVSIKATKAEIKADQTGDGTVIDRVISGHALMVTTEIAEIKNKDNWKVVFPWLNEVASGMNKQMFANLQMGRKDSSDAQQLILHPLSLADADLSGDFLFYKAIASGESEIVYGPAQQAKLKIVWNILPDFTTNPARLMVHGDPSIGLISASAGGPVFTGTGNGTMTGVSVFSGVTKTETITAVCIHASTNAGLFQVSGSLSGQLGVATVGVGFSSAFIAFTINDGSTDFIVGDQFTVATTAANYV